MRHRVNVMLEDVVWEALRKVPKGERSEVINRALRDWLVTRKRAAAARRMDALREAAPRVTTEEVVGWLREDRERPD